MSETRVVLTSDQKPALLSLLRRLPSILSGRDADVHGIAAGFKSRIGFAIFSLIAPNFEDLGRGHSGADGDKWPPLSQAYLAYSRRFGPGEQRALRDSQGLSGRANRFGPGDTKGLLTTDQLRIWRKTYAMHLARLLHRGMSENNAKAAAAGIAWNTVKKLGAKTKLEVYGNRTVQILVDTGRLRGSLQPGTISEVGVSAIYHKPSGLGANEQIFEDGELGKVSVGTNVKYAAYHHMARNKRRLRRLWPSTFPFGWWQQILGQAINGLTQIHELFRFGTPIDLRNTQDN